MYHLEIVPGRNLSNLQAALPKGAKNGSAMWPSNCSFPIAVFKQVINPIHIFCYERKQFIGF